MAQLSLKIVHMSWKSFFEAHVPSILLAGLLGVAAHVTSALIFQWSSSPLTVLVGTIMVCACTLILLILAYPKCFLGIDGLWMVDTLRMHFPTLQRLRLPELLNSEIKANQG